MEGEPSAHRAQPREAGQELPGRWAVPRAGLGRPRLRTGRATETETPGRLRLGSGQN